MEHPAARSRTSPSSTFVVSDMPKVHPSLLYAVRTLVGKGRLPCLGILVLRGQRVRVRFPFFSFLWFLLFSLPFFPFPSFRLNADHGVELMVKKNEEERKLGDKV